VLAQEPTQASMRARLRNMLDEVPAGGDAQASVLPGYPAGPESPVEASMPPGCPAGLALPRIAYLLPGLPPEGSGGSHSLVQEARGLRQLGASASVCVPVEALQTATDVYGNDDELFLAYVGEAIDALAQTDVVVATEYPSVDLLAQLARLRSGIVCAYYVQDYEPLFAPPESSRSDRALLSYRALPDLLLFAKTHWLCDLVGALHGVPVAKVAPSLDRELFHPGGRAESPGVLRVAAMIRPRTPRRRPAATLQALAAIECSIGDGVQLSTFGCDTDAFAQLADGFAEDWTPAVHHLGLLTRMEVAELMRRCDVFIDASAYQAFGRTGLEAMACGAVPLLPALGGVGEYAEHEHNALVLDEGSPEQIAAAVTDLAHAPERLARLREQGLRAAEGFSIQRAARSQLDLFSAAAANGRKEAR
jgi:hypothetical protein